MGLHHNQRPTGNTRLLLSQFSGAAAAYSLRLLSGFTGGKVVRVRRSSDNSERDFTSREIDNGTLEQWVNAQEVAPADYGDGAAAAYSLRYVSESYSGPVVRVRRSSDNTEQDFTPSEIESGSLESFCGSGDGLVTTWYDQSGNGNDATQTTASNQPKIVTAGVLVTENGKAAIDFDGVDDRLNSQQYLPSESFVTIFAIGKSRDSTGLTYDYSDRQVFLSGGKGFRLRDRSGQTEFLTFGSRSVNNNNTLTQRIITAIQNNTKRILAINNSDSVIDISSTGKLNFSTMSSRLPTIGSEINSNESNCLFQELVIYPSDQSANRTIIESNINSYYDIYTGPDGFVTTWYDQSGNGNDAVQTTASSQPRIVSASVLVTENGRPALDFDGVDDYMESTSQSIPEVFSALLIVALTTRTPQVDLGGVAVAVGSPSSLKAIGISSRINEELRYFLYSNDRDFSYSENVASLATFAIDVENDTREHRLNGDTLSKESPPSNWSLTTEQYYIGSNFSSSGGIFYGLLQEAIFYKSAEPSNRELIESNINNHYGIY